MSEEQQDITIENAQDAARQINKQIQKVDTSIAINIAYIRWHLHKTLLQIEQIYQNESDCHARHEIANSILLENRQCYLNTCDAMQSLRTERIILENTLKIITKDTKNEQ